MSVFHKDFVPRLLQAEAQFSTLNLTGRIPGPRYEDFDAVIDRANKWLASNPSACPASCEVVEVDGTYAPPTAADFQAQLVSTSNHNNGNDEEDTVIGSGVAAFLRILRYHYFNIVA
ncbi:hypothetical protein CAPTEDRAFT_222078 [Capitella teleta]|uniref:Uncharacterized protein n=1 Tax=Capitella teleta TaxID=283909 RepID=R7V6C1_CAPTE|nr:hypothetical protein CAPTEDRAFT_222078 [Capitella teleta]|eukprot:ELU14408.1 hypothetical protein CAPTEDRAFT_222078 [Capitella teleta]